MHTFTEQVLQHIQDCYDIAPDYLWARSPDSAALRHHGTKKWFAVLLMDTPRRVLGLPGEGGVDILDVKCDPCLIGSLVDGQRYLPGYHMNKEHWLTVLLDGSVPLAELALLIEASYNLTKA